MLDEATVKKISDFLFNIDGLDARTDIRESKVYRALMYYRILETNYDCVEAGAIADIMEKLAISRDRQGREEGVRVLGQGMPKSQKIEVYQAEGSVVPSEG